MASLVFPFEGVVSFFNSRVSNGWAYNLVDETYLTAASNAEISPEHQNTAHFMKCGYGYLNPCL
jgi:hypothetical protein